MSAFTCIFFHLQNVTLVVTISFCSCKHLTSIAQYGLVPFRVLKLKIEDMRTENKTALSWEMHLTGVPNFVNLHSCQHGPKKMRDVLLISLAFT